MRDLQECKAEVFRRSECRIKERRAKRKRLFACCVPLCICLVLVPFALHRNLPDKETFGEIGGAWNGHPTGGKPSPDTDGVTSMEGDMDGYQNIVMGDGFVGIESVPNVPESSAPLLGSLVSAEQSGEGFILVFREAGGQETVYRLENKTLISQADGQKRVLTDGQYVDLLQKIRDIIGEE